MLIHSRAAAVYGRLPVWPRMNADNADQKDPPKPSFPNRVSPRSSAAQFLSVSAVRAPDRASMPRLPSADRIRVQVQDVRNKRVTVAGLGRFGGNIAAARWLVEHGARVLVTDQAPAEKLADSVAQLDGLPITYHLGEQREEDFSKADLIVASPAIAPSSSVLRAARAADVTVTTEIRLFIERCPATIVGVTGTKGKSTTTAMLGEMLRAG